MDIFHSSQYIYRTIVYMANQFEKVAQGWARAGKLPRLRRGNCNGCGEAVVSDRSNNHGRGGAIATAREGQLPQTGQ